jgi:hypothetical protein
MFPKAVSSCWGHCLISCLKARRAMSKVSVPRYAGGMFHNSVSIVPFVPLPLHGTNSVSLVMGMIDVTEWLDTVQKPSLSGYNSSKVVVFTPDSMQISNVKATGLVYRVNKQIHLHLTHTPYTYTYISFG